MEKNKEQIEAMFDSIAPKYDTANRLLSLGIDRRWRKIVAKMVAADHPTNLLDVATGTADLIIALDKVGVKNITGVDLSEKMLEVGRAKLNQRQISAELIHCDALNLPLSESSFDAVTCAFGVRNFADTVAGLSQMAKVLRSAKKCYILEYSKIEKKGLWSALFNFYFRRVLPTLGGVISSNKGAYDYLPDSVQAFPSGEDFEQLMNQAGFDCSDRRSIMGGLATIYIGTKR